MNRIKIDEESKNTIYNSIKKKFENNLEKLKEDTNGSVVKGVKKYSIEWSISLNDFNTMLKTLFKEIDTTISLEKLVKSNFDYIKNLINEYNSKNLDYSKHEIAKYFKELYYRLDNTKIVQALGIRVCPYCNRNYILSFKNKSGPQLTAQLDHFYNKSTYPFLAVSIFNLIPSCPTCNVRKHAKDKDILNPYLDCFDENATFVYRGILNDHNHLDFFHEKRINLDIIIKNNKKQKLTKEYSKMFNIKELYLEHRDIVSDLLKKEIIYTESYISSFYNNYKDLFDNEKEVIEMILNTNIDKNNMHNKPMTKLTCDIAKQLEIIK